MLNCQDSSEALLNSFKTRDIFEFLKILNIVRASANSALDVRVAEIICSNQENIPSNGIAKTALCYNTKYFDNNIPNQSTNIFANLAARLENNTICFVESSNKFVCTSEELKKKIENRTIDNFVYIKNFVVYYTSLLAIIDIGYACVVALIPIDNNKSLYACSPFNINRDVPFLLKINNIVKPIEFINCEFVESLSSSSSSSNNDDIFSEQEIDI